MSDISKRTRPSRSAKEKAKEVLSYVDNMVHSSTLDFSYRNDCYYFLRRIIEAMTDDSMLPGMKLCRLDYIMGEAKKLRARIMEENRKCEQFYSSLDEELSRKPEYSAAEHREAV